jgi:hypothetical protein
LAEPGAIATIMASLTGSLSQQLVVFQNCVELDEFAMMSTSRTETYRVISGGVGQFGSRSNYAPMIAAIKVGIIQPVGDFTNTLLGFLKQ